jgi:hypothetical protein
LHQSTQNHEIVYSDRSSEYEQILIRSLLRKTKDTNMADGSVLKLIFCSAEKTHEPLYLDEVWYDER